MAPALDQTGLANAAPRVLIVAEHASAKFGGEAVLPLHYFRLLRERGVPAWLVVHDRTRSELERLLPEEISRVSFIEDTWAHRWLWRLGQSLPDRIAHFSTGLCMRVITQITQRQVVKALVKLHGIDVVHQPMPVSPKEPSLIYNVGAPVIMGPMNGGIDYPPAFSHLQGRSIGLAITVGRAFSSFANMLMPGKAKAHTLLVANERTRKALPTNASSHVVELVENGVDLSTWRNKVASSHDACESSPPGPEQVVQFMFMGRLVDWKAVDLLLTAFARAQAQTKISLTIAGDGAERVALETLAKGLGVLTECHGEPGKAWFAGWQSQESCARLLASSDALILPSLMECGGAVVLEAMAVGVPVIASDWGGPADYLDQSCGILVKPDGRESFIDGLCSAMLHLAANPALRKSMGESGRKKVRAEFDWQHKIDQILQIYSNTVRRP